ncbi:MAG: NAD(P)-dependent oxidoreductase [Candidatus Omnitrophota bacterium]
MNILITGATGFIGKTLLKELAATTNHKITCLIRDPKKAHIVESLGAKVIYGDITDKQSLKPIESLKFDAIFHSAALVMSKNYKLLYKTNVIGTENICRLALKLSVLRFVHVSSIAVVGASLQIPVTEDVSYCPTNAYGLSKTEAELKIIEFRKMGLPAVIIRPPVVYGEEEPHMLKKLLFLLKFRLLPLIENGKHKLHMAYVKNVASALIYSLTKKEFLKGSFFTADEEALTIREIFDIFSDAIGTKPAFSVPLCVNPFLLSLPFLGKRFATFTKDKIFDISRIKSLGFNPPYQARKSLELTANSFKHIHQPGSNITLE